MQLPGDGRPAVAASVRRLEKTVAHVLRHGQWNKKKNGLWLGNTILDQVHRAANSLHRACGHVAQGDMRITPLERGFAPGTQLNQLLNPRPNGLVLARPLSARPVFIFTAAASIFWMRSRWA